MNFQGSSRGRKVSLEVVVVILLGYVEFFNYGNYEMFSLERILELERICVV